MHQLAEELIQEAYDQIEQFESRVQAMVPEQDRRSRLLAEAETLDRDLQPFLIGVKDIINVDGLPTRAGSRLPAQLFEGHEATVVSRLKAAGALVVGKTTTTEFAYSDPAPTTNPHNELHTPGGSSSGSAAAVAAGYIPLALGTQTVDSIVTPAAYCGVVGFKPTFDRIPIDGVVPFSAAMDTVGFLAKDLDTVAFAAEITVDDWREVGVNGTPILGIPAPEYLDLADSQARAAFDQAVKLLEAAGYEIVQTERLSDISAIARRHRKLIAAQFTSVHCQWYKEYGSRYQQRSAALFVEGESAAPAEVTEGLESSALLREELAQTMADLGIDVWISPATTDPAPQGLDSIGDPIMGLPWTHALLPVVCLPAGFAANGLPLGIQLAGRFDGDEELIEFAQAIGRVLSRK